MAIYHTTTATGAITSLEWLPSATGNAACITLRDDADVEAVIAMLGAAPMGQSVVTRTILHGDTLLITHGALTQAELLQQLAAHGEMLAVPLEKPKTNWWAYRGAMGILGQLMQLTAAFLQVEKVGANHPRLNPDHPHYAPHLKPGMWVRKPFAMDIGIFAILNLTANFGNILYGGQKEPDTHRLRNLKTAVNDTLSSHFLPEQAPLDINEKRAKLRTKDAPPLGFWGKTNEFLQHNSVRFFELGLRFVAASALVFPVSRAKLGQGARLLSQGKPIEAYYAARNSNRLVELGGWGYIVGKVIAWFSKIPDPYSPTPHTTLDTVREKLLFPVGSLIESAAGVSIATAAFKDKRIGLVRDNTPDITPHRDLLGTGGGSLFAAAYLMRLGADFGSKKLDLPELIAHTSDTLAKVSPNKRASATVNISARLAEYINDPKYSFGTIYHLIREDMRTYHPELEPQSTRRVPPPEAPTPAAEMEQGGGAKPEGRTALLPEIEKNDLPEMPHAKTISSSHAPHVARSHTERLRAHAAEPTPRLTGTGM